MVATVQIIEINGPTATPTTTQKDGQTVRPKNADNATVDNNNPMVIPTAGTDYSYAKQLRLNVTVAPSVNISNLGFYTDGSNTLGTGVLLYAKTGASYAAPYEPTGVAGFTDAFTYTSGSKLSLGAGPYTGTGQKGNLANLLLTVGTTATQGQTPNETLTFSYDEI